MEALEACDFIAAEDTRVTLRLLNHFGVKKPLVSYYEHNKRTRGEALCARLLAGENGVLVSDCLLYTSPAAAGRGTVMPPANVVCLLLWYTNNQDSARSPTKTQRSRNLWAKS